MSDYGDSRFRGAARAKVRLKIAGLLALAAVGLAIFAIRFQAKPYWTSTPAGRRAGQRYSRMWFDTGDNLTGAFWQGNRLILERWPGANPARTWRFDIGAENPEQLLWTVAEDGSRLAWISGSNLQVQSVAEGSTPASIPLPKRRVLALSLLSGGSVAAVFEDSSVNRWDAATGAPLGEWRAPIRDAERAAADGNYLAFSSIREGELVLYNFHGQQWSQVQTALSPELPERILLPAPGVGVAMSEGRVRVGGLTRPSPGAIRSVAAHLYDIFAAGDFEGIFVLPPEGEYYRLAAAVPDSLVACGQRGFAISGADGTSLFALGSENRLTPAGRKISWASAGLLLLGAALAFAPVLLLLMRSGFRALFGRKARGGRAPVGLKGPLPPELVKACASGEMVLWAGAGLSAQSGFPLRTNFITTLFQAVALEGWADAGLVRKLAKMATAGKAEAALDQLAAAIGSQRGPMISHYTAIFARFSPPSRSHELLARLRLQSAVTTNYDILLEQTDERWCANVVTPGPDRLTGRFLLKLYGNLRVPSTVLLSRSELKHALGKWKIDALLRTLDEHPVLFAGCSLHGLLADMEMIGMPKKVAQKRFAIAGVAGPSWGKEADELWSRYGIEVLACWEDDISQDLPAFLDRLVRAMEGMTAQVEVVAVRGS